jgi:hypothetical protein
LGEKRQEIVGREGDGGEDPEDGVDAGDTVVEEDDGVTWIGEFSGGYGGDDEAADDEEEVDAEGSVIEEAHEIGGAVFQLDAVKMAEDDEDGCEAAADLDAYDVARLGWPCGLQGADPLHHCINVSGGESWVYGWVGGKLRWWKFTGGL